MGTPFPATYAQSYFDHIQIANMEGHPPGTTPGMDGFEPRQLPLLQVRTQWPSYSLGGDHSAASGSASVDASGSEFGFADPASWSNTPHPQSDSPLLHNTALTGYTNLAGAGGAFAMDQYSTLDLSVPPQHLAPEDLDSHRTGTTPYETTPVGPTLRAESHLSFPTGGGGHSRNGSSVSLPSNLISASSSRDCDDDGDDDEENGSPGGGRRRKRARRSDPDGQPRRRFACPYQVADPTLDCFHPGRRNRLGGCQSIYRLRQHFRRRHRRSHRCETCWKSFERADLAAKHREKGGCRPAQYGAGHSEMFMTPEQEKEVEKAVGSRSEEECWWDIFRVLVDGETDLATLQSRYSAYYVPNTTRDLGGLLAQTQTMLPPPQQFGHASGQHQHHHHPQFDMMSAAAAGLMDPPQFMLTDTQFELQSTSQDTITLRHGGGGGGGMEAAAAGAAQGYGDPPQQQASAAAAVDARTHLRRIRELVFMGLDDQASAHESLAQIRAILPALEQSIR